ncbi:MAG TPA: pilus assembly protein PilP [Candidatus Binatia bacterium]|jgi:type IV pilus assembly protein PilP
MKLWTTALMLVAGLAFARAGFSEEALPSQKTKEAVDKFNQTPSAIGQKFDDIKSAIRDKIAKGSAQPVSTGADPFAAPEKTQRPDMPQYSPMGKRDPFQPPMKSQAKRRPRENLSPLERYEIGQLSLVGVVWDIKDPRAMVEDSSGLGYVVRVGTPIGPNEGKIKQIKPAEVVIEENFVDFYGARKNREVSMRIVSE